MNRIIAAVRDNEEFEKVFDTRVEIVFDLNADLFDLKEKSEKIHKNGRKLFIHFDLATGIGKDKSGILYAKKSGVDGIISTRQNIIKLAREAGLFTVQRFFIVDSQSLNTAVETVKFSKPDMVEIMPGIIPKAIKDIKNTIEIPVIAGGLIETKEEIDAIIKSGASAISTGKKELWGY